MAIEYSPEEQNPANDPELPQPDSAFSEPPTLGPADVNPLTAGEEAQLEFEQEQNRANLAAENFQPEPVNIDDDPNVRALDEASRAESAQIFNEQTDPNSAFSQQTNALLENARNQQGTAARVKTPSNGDWRVRISLAPNSDYLYNDASTVDGVNSILAPLKGTNGVIFPYTPQIETSYKANYDTVDLAHSNYRGYFYKNSYVDAVNIRGTFTAQDTKEASYLLAVIHFFRSVTKMFYGQDPSHRGSPPPLVYLYGLGEYQFNNHPCLVSTFNYSLPNEVDYIRVDPNNYGLNMLAQKTPAFTGAGNLLSAIKARLTSAGGIPLGGIFQTPQQSTVTQTVNTTGNATYGPTKMEISVTLLPVQSRKQVSQLFSLKKFANGNQLKGGFW